MSDLMLLSEAQMRRIEPYFPLSRGYSASGMTPTGFETPLPNARSPPAFRQGPTKRSRFDMTLCSTNSATKSKTCSEDWRRIHTRYDRCAHTFFSSICIAAAVIFWL
ncbi:hypothetical protein [Phyllobacterium zundukense]|uniref:hypothetical protein n=1 Tax=Phyllobacterium zundukense TaxID=1867719 RepID=UPI0019514D52|nr:hypothetical protein [Phyllobacterium zundukense]